MFQVIIVSNPSLNVELLKSNRSKIAYTSIGDETLLFCFNFTSTRLTNLLDELSKAYVLRLSPMSYHFLYKKKFYYHPLNEPYLFTDVNEGTLIKEISTFQGPFKVFFECRHQRRHVESIITFYDCDDFKQQIHDYEIKFFIPFYMRDVKMMMNDQRLRFKDLSILYLLEFRAIEGKKR